MDEKNQRITQEVLLTWVGARDPGWENPRTGQLEFGPVLSLLAARHFDIVYLFFNLESNTVDFRQKANEVLRLAQKKLPDVEVRHRPVDVVSVIDYRELYRVVNRECQSIQRELTEESNLFVYLSPGTPQMQTTWVLLVQSGLLNATMLDTTPREFLCPGIPVWRTVDLTLDDFPKVISPGVERETLGVLEAQLDNLASENIRLQAELDLCRTPGPTVLADALGEGFSLRGTLREQEAALYRLALLRTDGNGAEAARLLGVEPPAFRARAATLGVRPRLRRSKNDS
jgi:hypothetical protein